MINIKFEVSCLCALYDIITHSSNYKILSVKKLCRLIFQQNINTLY